MKKLSLIYLLIFKLTLAYSQNSADYEFIGTLQLPGNEIISYKLNFKEFGNGKLEGFSLTDIYGNDRTKSSIIGNINTTSQKISFKETNNISTKSNSNESEFCYIQVTNAKIKTLRGKTIIQGNFNGKYANGKSCVNGYIYLVSTKYLEKLETEYLSADKIKNADTLAMLKEKVSALKDRAEKNTLKRNEVLNINWSSNEVILEIWDGEQEDLDEIQVYINDKKIVDQLVLKRQKKILIIPLTEKISSIKIVGIHEGLSAPCTANIILRDGIISTPVISVLKKGESNTIRINKINNEN